MNVPASKPVAAAGGALAVGGVAAGPILAIAGLVPPLAAAFLSAAALAAAVTGAARLVRGRRNPEPPAQPAQDPAGDLDRLEAVIAGKVPPAIQARVDRVAKTVRDILPRMDTLGPGSAQAHAVVRTATSYLPEAVGSYLRLPRDYADRRPISGGKTSLMVLCDQLDLLAGKMDEVFVAVCQSDVDALITHGRFLAEKFSSGALTLGGPDVMPA
jgi:hypothetical protein